MDCSEARDAMLSGGGAVADVAVHIRGCDRCRETVRVAERLQSIGVAQRDVDLEIGRVYETRRRAAALLAGLKGGTVARVLPGWRMAVGACALALILASVATQFLPGPPDQRMARRARPASRVGGSFEVDAEIETLSKHLDAGFRLFRARHLAVARTPDAETRADVLQTRISGLVDKYIEEM